MRLLLLLMVITTSVFSFTPDENNYIQNRCLYYGIDYHLILAIAENESNFNWDAIGNSGEIGAFQIKPSTYNWLVKRIAPIYGSWLKYEPLSNNRVQIEAVCLYIKWLFDEYEGAYEVLIHYNASWRKEEYATEVLKTYQSYR